MYKMLKFAIHIAILLFTLSCTTVDLTIRADAKDIVFKDINLIAMTSRKVEEKKSVYISNGIIKQIGNFNDLDFPEDAAIVDALGRYLLPGFNDMHVHTYDIKDFSLYIASGVTTVRHMSGEDIHLERKEQLQNRSIQGPHLYTSGPLTDGPGAHWPGSKIITDPDKVEDYIIQLKEDGYDFVKVYEKLNREVFYKIMKVAGEYDMPVAGHIPKSVFASEAIDLGMTSVEHFEGYDIWATGESMDEIVRLTAKSGIWNCPTLILLRNTEEHRRQTEKYSIESIPELKYVDPENIDYWKKGWEFNYFYKEKVQFLKLIYKAGANIVSGTDQGFFNPYIVPGFGLHTELELMNKAGLTPYDVLVTTTVNPAIMLGIEDKAGTIEVRKMADMVLLDKNPLEDIKNTTTIRGVMIRGEWFDRKRLDKMLQAVEDSYK